MSKYRIWGSKGPLLSAKLFQSFRLKSAKIWQPVPRISVEIQPPNDNNRYPWERGCLLIIWNAGSGDSFVQPSIPVSHLKIFDSFTFYFADVNSPLNLPNFYFISVLFFLSLRIVVSVASKAQLYFDNKSNDPPGALYYRSTTDQFPFIIIALRRIRWEKAHQGGCVLEIGDISLW